MLILSTIYNCADEPSPNLYAIRDRLPGVATDHTDDSVESLMVQSWPLPDAALGEALISRPSWCCFAPTVAPVITPNKKITADHATVQNRNFNTLSPMWEREAAKPRRMGAGGRERGSPLIEILVWLYRQKMPFTPRW